MFLVTEDWYFCLHRLPMAELARAMGMEIFVGTRIQDKKECIENLGFHVVNVEWNRRSISPIQLIKEIWRVRALIRELDPDIIQLIAVRPIVAGGLATLFGRSRAIISNFAGLGYLYSSAGVVVALLRSMVSFALGRLLRRKGNWVLVENRGDAEFATQVLGVAADRVHLIKGIGVDTGLFLPAANARTRPDVFRVGLVSRMLWSKGVGILVDAIRTLRTQTGAPHVEALLVGEPDPGNPDSVPGQQLLQWREDGLVDWLGYREDIPRLLQDLDALVLPTQYAEGVPRCLIEGAATGLPCIATDTVSCREIIRDGENGFLIPAGDSVSLAEKIRKLAEDPALGQRMGQRGREIVEKEFEVGVVKAATRELYEEIIASLHRPREAKDCL